MRSAAEILREIIPGITAEKQPVTLLGEWPEIAGHDIACHLKITDIVSGTLVLEADHSGWIQVADLKKNEFLVKIRQKFPEKNISNIKVHLKKQ
ncbi:MAG: DUF721 domain-containing protein [Spirochaetia bacterium]|nr:DUF721 domain-containing protein [Spirochaetia bacterium]